MSPLPLYILNRKPSVPSLLNWDLKNMIPRNALTRVTFSFGFGFLHKNQMWPFPEAPLDQGAAPACIGFGGAGFMGTAPVEDPVTNQTGLDLYKLCKLKDHDPQDGSTVHILAMVLRDLKRIQRYAFAHSTEIIDWWMRNRGPFVFGTSWTQGMMQVDSSGFIHPTGPVVGGHCTCGRGIQSFPVDDAYYIQNSWDHEFGDDYGGGWMYKKEFNQLLHAQGEALAAVELPL